jgi:hypothetical protein
LQCGVVREAEGADDGVPGAHGFDRAADFDNDAAIFVSHMGRLIRRLQTAIRPEIGPADACGRQFDDGVRRPDDLGILNLFETNIAGPVHDCGKHGHSSSFKGMNRRRGILPSGFELVISLMAVTRVVSGPFVNGARLGDDVRLVDLLHRSH